jgi:hypothetical protein
VRSNQELPYLDHLLPVAAFEGVYGFSAQPWFSLAQPLPAELELGPGLDLAVICKPAKLSAEQKRQHWQRSRDAIGLVRRHLRSLAMVGE